ncbi:hypothetical protein LINPERHAP1_LOCUS37954 [Linum perenne]
MAQLISTVTQQQVEQSGMLVETVYWPLPRTMDPAP